MVNRRLACVADVNSLATALSLACVMPDKRIEILLLVNALAAFASWLAGLACEAAGITHWLSPRRSVRRLYSVLRLGREALVRSWPTEHLLRWLDRLRSLPSTTLTHMQVPA